MHHGSCLCGAVSFDVRGALPAADACHCTNCRKFSGHYLVAPDVPRDAVTLRGADHVRWYASSDKVRRGFCGTCGSTLFFDPIDQAKHSWIAISLGAFDGPTGASIKEHVFVADKGDYYEITDGKPQYDTHP